MTCLFWVVGQAQAQTRGQLRDEIRRRGLSERARYIPAVPFHDMPGVYAALREGGGVLVLTSEEEAFGLVLAEAMATGIPVVSRQVGGTSEVVAQGETGYRYWAPGRRTTRPSWACCSTATRTISASPTRGERGCVSASRPQVAARYARLFRASWRAKARPGVVVTSGSRWGTSGGGQRPRKLAEAFAALGWEVAFIEQFGVPEAHDDPPEGVRVLAAGELLAGIERGELEWSPRERAALTDGIRRALTTTEPVLAVNCDYSPLALEHMWALKTLGARVVYDCMDEWELFCEQMPDAGYFGEVEAEMCKLADLVTASADTLADRLVAKFGLERRPVAIHNCLDPELMLRRSDGDPLQLPEAAVTVGYVGSIWGRWQDWPLVLSIARARPDWQIVLWAGGRRTAPSAAGPRPGWLPRRMCTSSASCRRPRCIATSMPSMWRSSRSRPRGARYVHPLKVYDYLARMRPVVSSYLPEIEGFPGCGWSRRDRSGCRRSRPRWPRAWTRRRCAGSCGSAPGRRRRGACWPRWAWATRRADPGRGLRSPSRPPGRVSEMRLLVIAIDAMSPRRVVALGGRLPALHRLAQEGTVTELAVGDHPCTTEQWTSFATGLPRRGHRVRGLTREDRGQLWGADALPRERLPDVMLNRQGVTVGLFNLPVVTHPPRPLAGWMASGDMLYPQHAYPAHFEGAMEPYPDPYCRYDYPPGPVTEADVKSKHDAIFAEFTDRAEVGCRNLARLLEWLEPEVMIAYWHHLEFDPAPPALRRGANRSGLRPSG